MSDNDTVESLSDLKELTGDAPAAEAFSDQVAAHHRRLAGFAYLMCGDRTIADGTAARESANPRMLASCTASVPQSCSDRSSRF